MKLLSSLFILAAAQIGYAQDCDEVTLNACIVNRLATNPHTSCAKFQAKPAEYYGCLCEGFEGQEFWYVFSRG